MTLFKLTLAISVKEDFFCKSRSSMSLLFFHKLNKLLGIIRDRIGSLLAIFLKLLLLRAPLNAILVASSFSLMHSSSLFSSFSRSLSSSSSNSLCKSTSSVEVGIARRLLNCAINLTMLPAACTNLFIILGSCHSGYLHN